MYQDLTIAVAEEKLDDILVPVYRTNDTHIRLSQSSPRTSNKLLVKTLILEQNQALPEPETRN